jgi:hypothetical protein
MVRFINGEIVGSSLNDTRTPGLDRYAGAAPKSDIFILM